MGHKKLFSGDTRQAVNRDKTVGPPLTSDNPCPHKIVRSLGPRLGATDTRPTGRAGIGEVRIEGDGLWLTLVVG